MLSIAFNEFKSWAKTLKEEKGIDYSASGRDVIQVMADGYCVAKDTNNERDKNMYVAGLMLRFWYQINKLKVRSPIQGLDYMDFMGWLFEAIEYACKYRKWQNPANKVNAQQCINQCVETIRVQKYYDLNLQKNKVNVNTYSLDSVAPNEEDAPSLLETLVDEDSEYRANYIESSYAAYSLVQHCIDKKKIVEAIILDTIAFNDVQKVTKKTVKSVDSMGNPVKYTQRSSEFWPFRCVQILSNLPEDYSKYFHKHYKVVEAEFEAALSTIRNANNQKLYRYLSKTLESAKKVYSFV
jgi:hypothetical protein